MPALSGELIQAQPCSPCPHCASNSVAQPHLSSTTFPGASEGLGGGHTLGSCSFLCSPCPVISAI